MQTCVQPRGYLGEMNGVLKGRLYAVAYDDGSVAFGSLETNRDKQPCPVGRWLTNDWFAHGFIRKPGPLGQVALRITQGPGVPRPMAGMDVTWFRPVDADDQESVVWTEFMEQVPSTIRGKFADLTFGQPFGGLGQAVTVTDDTRQTSLIVDGVVCNGLKFAYQFGLGQELRGRIGQPAALVRGWGETPGLCRIIYHEHVGNSHDATFSHN